jgi:hypothetical protein
MTPLKEVEGCEKPLVKKDLTSLNGWVIFISL